MSNPNPEGLDLGNPFMPMALFTELLSAQLSGDFEKAARTKRNLELYGYFFEYRHPGTEGPSPSRSGTRKSTKTTRRAAEPAPA